MAKMSYWQRAYRRNKKFLSKYKKNKKCKICNYGKHPEILVFHHIHSNKKEDTVAKMAYTNRVCLKRLEKEIEKCKLLCPNCHALVTLNQKKKKKV